MTPSATIHCAGVWSLAETHSSRFLPSKRMMASEGGAVEVAPGVTIAGWGDQTSVSSGFGTAGACGWVAVTGVWAASGDNSVKIDAANTITVILASGGENTIRIIGRRYTERQERADECGT